MTSNQTLKKNAPKITFWIYIIVLLIVSEVPESLFYRPQSVHQWRQADGASQALNFHQNNVGLFTPQIHTHIGKNGSSASEFPILYWITGKLYDVFGYHEFLLRGLCLGLAVLSWWLLYLFSSKIIGDDWLGMIPSVFLSTSPFYFFYANNFLPNVPALSFAIIGFYYFHRYVSQNQLRNLFFAGGAFLLANLLKISDGICFVAIICMLVYGFLFKIESIKSLIPQKHISKAISLVIGMGILTTAWYQYAAWYNDAAGNTATLLGIYPIWEMNKTDWELADYLIFDVWWDQYHHPIITYILLALSFFFVIFWNRLNPIYRFFTLILFAGTFCYSMLWFKAFPMHDYYCLSLLIFPIFLLITCFESLQRLSQEKNWVRGVSIFLLLLFVGIGIFQNKKIQHYRYHSKQHRTIVNPALYTITPYLRSIGIERTDKVLSLPDPSPNISLYLMNNPGYTEFVLGEDYPVDYFIKQGTQYLIINDSSYLERKNIVPHIGHQIGHYEGVNIYELREKEGKLTE